jgi:hypothetical protein
LSIRIPEANISAQTVAQPLNDYRPSTPFEAYGERVLVFLRRRWNFGEAVVTKECELLPTGFLKLG